jgi:hypothetical protein
MRRTVTVRGTANTGAQANGAGSAVDGTPRMAQGLGGLVRMTGAWGAGKKRGDGMVTAPGYSGPSGPPSHINNRRGNHVTSRVSGDPQAVLSM